VAHSTSTNNADIFTEIVSLEEINDHITINLVDVIDVTEDGLAHHVHSENIVVNVLHQSFHVVIVGGFQLLPDGVLLHLEVIIVIVRVADHITENFNGFCDIILEG